MSNNMPFQLLQSMRQQAQDLAQQRLSYTSQSAEVKNIAFAVKGLHFYCEAKDIKEVSVCSNMMVVPQTKRWMRGLVNSKGVLYSVNDLSLMAGFDSPVKAENGHLLLLSDVDSQSALLVSRVIGFRYFEKSQRLLEIQSKQEVLDGLSAFVTEGYHAEGCDWFGLDIERLLASAQFREIQ